MSPLPHWLFLFGTAIVYLIVGLVVFVAYGRHKPARGK